MESTSDNGSPLESGLGIVNPAYSSESISSSSSTSFSDSTTSDFDDGNAESEDENSDGFQGIIYCKRGARYYVQRPTESAEGTADERGEETDSSERTADYSASGTSHSDEGTSHSDEGTSHSDEGTSYSDEGTSYSDEGTSYSDEGTSYSDEGTSHVYEVSGYRFEEGISEGTTDSREGSFCTDEATSSGRGYDIYDIDEWSTDSQDSDYSDEELNSGDWTPIVESKNPYWLPFTLDSDLGQTELWIGNLRHQNHGHNQAMGGTLCFDIASTMNTLHGDTHARDFEKKTLKPEETGETNTSTQEDEPTSDGPPTSWPSYGRRGSAEIILSVPSPRELVFQKSVYHTLPYRSRNPTLHPPIACVSPVMQLYMQKCDPCLQDYVHRVLGLSSGDTAESGSGEIVPISGGRDSNNNNNLHALPSPDSSTQQTLQPATNTPTKVSEQTQHHDQSCPLKPKIQEQAQAIRRQAVREAIFGVLRNLACYTLLAAIVLIIIQGGLAFYEHLLWESIVPMILLGIGVLGVAFQVKHVVQECKKGRSRSLVAKLLAEGTRNQSDFINMIQTRTACAPYVATEIKQKHRIEITDPQKRAKHVRKDAEGRHWLRISKKISKNLTYKSWSDGSEDINARDWGHGGFSWIIVAKDYRAANQQTEVSMQTEIKQFCKDNSFHGSHGKRLKLLLDVMEGEAYPDVQALLVRPDRRKSCFYAFSLYKALLYMGLDSIYKLVFHMVTKYNGQYDIVKIIERDVST